MYDTSIVLPSQVSITQILYFVARGSSLALVQAQLRILCNGRSKVCPTTCLRWLVLGVQPTVAPEGAPLIKVFHQLLVKDCPYKSFTANAPEIHWSKEWGNPCNFDWWCATPRTLTIRKIRHLCVYSFGLLTVLTSCHLSPRPAYLCNEWSLSAGWCQTRLIQRRLSKTIGGSDILVQVAYMQLVICKLFAQLQTSNDVNIYHRFASCLARGATLLLGLSPARLPPIWPGGPTMFATCLSGARR